MQVGDLAALAPGGFDRVISEFGVMFFDDPVAAFANIAAAVRPRATMVFACWRSLAENQMFSLGTHLLVAAHARTAPAAEPGPAGPGGVRRRRLPGQVLDAAGWIDIDIAPVDVDLRFGIDGSDGVEERLAVILSGSTGSSPCRQLRPMLGDQTGRPCSTRSAPRLRTSMVDGAVQFPGSHLARARSRGDVRRYRTIVVGLGAMGSAAAAALARRGVDVLGVEQFGSGARSWVVAR